MAGCGQGKDADQVDDKERALRRRQALDWLRQDLAWWGKALDNGNELTGAEVRRRLHSWQTDVDLAGLREPDALDRLPPEERQECLVLWNDVAAALRRSQSTK